jgi:DNA-directed RNA polymerase specialized sigma subunit
MSVLKKVAKLADVAVGTRQDQDLALWRKWKQSPTDANASALLKAMDPLIQREVNKWSGSLARPLLETEGKRIAMGAFHDYDPNRGAALGTHVVNQLQKMSRLSYSNQNVARLPENKMLQFHAHTMADTELRDRLGRSPTADELSDHLGWSNRHLSKFRQEIGHQELLESGGTEGSSAGTFTAEETDHTLDFIHHDLAPRQRAIFEHLTGYGGTEILTNQQIQKKLKITQGQYSYDKKKLIDHVEDVNSRKR